MSKYDTGRRPAFSIGNVKEAVQRLLNKALVARANEQKAKEQAEKEKAQAEGTVTDCSFLSLDGGTWNETFINSRSYNGGQW